MGGSLGSGGDLGIVANRAEEAALAWGRPLDDLTVPPPADPKKVAKAGRAWVRKPSGPTPFDGVPDVVTAAWFATQAIEREPVTPGKEVISWAELADPAVRERWRFNTARVDPKEQLARADAAALAAATDGGAAVPLSFPVRSHDWGLLPSPLDVGARLALRGPDGVLDVEAALAGTLPPRDVLGLRAYGLPGVTPEVRERMLAVVADLGAEPATRLTLSALVAGPEDHHALVLDLGPEALTWVNPTKRGDQVLLTDRHLLVAVGAALVDPDARRTLWYAVDDLLRSGIGEPLASSFRHPDMALVVFGEPVLAGLTGHKWLASWVGKQTTALLQRLSGPAAVPWALQLVVQDSRAAGPVRDWLVQHRAVVGAYDGSLNAARTEQLVAVVPALVAAGQTEFAHPAAAAAAGQVVVPAGAAVLGADGLPAWWTEAVAAEADAGEGAKVPRRLPAWVADIPLTVAGQPVAEEEATALLVAAARTEPDGPRRPLVAAAVERMTPAERDLAGLHLLRGWIAAGERTQDKPFARAGAVLGHDGWVAETMERVREWNEGRYNRAKLGLELVTLNASPAAAAALTSARTWKKGGMDWVAAEQLVVLADLLGTTTEDLDLQLVATGDLDARSTRVLDYGPRAFRAGLQTDGKVVLHLLDAEGRPSGKPRASLPAANSADDPLKVAAAKKALTALRKTVAEVGRTQGAQLQAALVSGRTWSAHDHATHVAGHPILNPLFRGVVWRATAPDGAATLVRFDEGGEYLTVDEDTFVTDGTTLRVVHPVHLTAAEREAWRTHLADHELVPPFPQVDRLDGVVADPSGAPAVPTGVLHPGTLHGTLAGHGWGMGAPDDDRVAAYEQAFGQPDETWLVAAIHVTGVLVYNPALSGDQQVTGVEVRRGDAVVPWAELDPVVAAEVHRAVAALAAKAV